MNYTESNRKAKRQTKALSDAAPALLDALQLGLLLIERIEANDTLDEHEKAFADSARAAIKQATQEQP